MLLSVCGVNITVEYSYSELKMASRKRDLKCEIFFLVYLWSHCDERVENKCRWQPISNSLSSPQTDKNCYFSFQFREKYWYCSKKNRDKRKSFWVGLPERGQKCEGKCMRERHPKGDEILLIREKSAKTMVRDCRIVMNGTVWQICVIRSSDSAQCPFSVWGWMCDEHFMA